VSRTYEAAASAADVVGFYVKGLGADPEDGMTDPVPLRIWQTSGVDCMVTYQPDSPASVSLGIFRWGSQSPGGDEYSFSLTITAGEPPASARKTRIAVLVIMVNKGIAAAEQEKAAEQSADAADTIVKGLNRQDPEKVRIVDAMRDHPPSDRALAELVQKEFGVRLYPKMRLDLRAMEIYTYDLWGGTGGYWFVSHDLPDKLVAFYEKLTGNRAYMGALDPTKYIDITGRDGKRTGCIAIYQGTTSLLVHEEPEDADPNEVWLVSTVGFYSKGPRQEEQGGR
jgi:hypothetical protein